MIYNIDDFVAEFKGTYDAATYKAKALNIQDIYISTYAYVVNGQTRYGLFSFPDAGGLAYWTNLALTNNWDLSSQDLLRAIFAAADGVPDYYNRTRTAVKQFSGDLAFLDRTYGIDGFLAEFVPQYNLDTTRFNERAYTIAWAVYLSGYEYTLSNGSKRYGLRRLPDAGGLAYWTSQLIIYNATDQQFIDAFFAAVASAGGTEASRALTPNKSFEGSIAFSDKTGAKYGIILPNYNSTNQGYSYLDRIYYTGTTRTVYYTAPTIEFAKVVLGYISPAINIPATTIPQFPTVTHSINVATKTITVTITGGNISSYILLFVR